MLGVIQRNQIWHILLVVMVGGLVLSYFSRMPSLWHAVSSLGGWLGQNRQPGPSLEMQLSSGLRALLAS